MPNTIKNNLVDKLNAAVAAIDNKNYQVFMDALVNLGEHLQAIESVKKSIQQDETTQSELINAKQQVTEKRRAYLAAKKALAKNKTEIEQHTSEIEQIKTDYFAKEKEMAEKLDKRNAAIQKAIADLNLAETEHLRKVNNKLALLAFMTVWKESYLKDIDVSRGQLRAKAGLEKSTRHAIHLALLALDKLAITNEKVERLTNPQQVKEEYDAPAAKAIAGYMTTRQKVLSGLGKFLAFFVALSSGLMTGVAIITTLGVTWPVLLAATVLFAAGTYVNFKAFKSAVPNFLLSIAGKDKLFAGFTKYFNKVGEVKHLSLGRKFLLAASLVFSTAVGVTFGALTYSAIVGLSSIPMLSFLSVGVIGAALPPVGIVLAAVTAFGMVALMARSFVALLQTENLKQSFIKPFSAIAKVFQKEAEANKDKSPLRLAIEKAITYSVVAVVATAGLVGLGLFSYTCSVSVADFLTNMLSVAPKIATGVGFAIGMGLSFVGQIPFIVEAAALMTAKMASYFRNGVAKLKNFFSPSAAQSSPLPSSSPLALEQPNNSAESAISYKPTLSLRLQSVGQTLKQGLNKVGNALVSVIDFGSKIVNAVGNGFLAIPRNVLPWFANLSLGTATLNSMNFGFSGDAVGSAKNEQLKDKASDVRVTILMGGRQDNEGFEQKEASVEMYHPSGFHLLDSLRNGNKKFVADESVASQSLEESSSSSSYQQDQDEQSSSTEPAAGTFKKS